MASSNGGQDCDDLPPPPPVPADVVPETSENGMATNGDLPHPPPVAPNVQSEISADVQIRKKRTPMKRPGLAQRGVGIKLFSNYFPVEVKISDAFFYHYSVNVKYEDGTAVDSKGVGRKVLDKLKKMYDLDLGSMEFAYDGEKSLFTVGPLPSVKNEFMVVLEDIQPRRAGGDNSPDGNGNESPGAERKRAKRSYQPKQYKVEINFAAKVPMAAIDLVLRGRESENSMEALRVLDIILRQHASKLGCLLVKQSFFHDDQKDLAPVGGGIMACRGFHSSFRGTQRGLSLNIDVSTTMIIRPGSVVQFLLENQNVNEPGHLDWSKAKRMLKNLRITVAPTNTEYKITGLSEENCRTQRFSLKGEEITVLEYFENRRNMQVRKSANFPCINVGKPKRPTYIPIELCTLVSLQRYTKALSGLQRAKLVELSRQRPQDRMKTLHSAMGKNAYNSNKMLQDCGITISDSFAKVDGRILAAPKLKSGNGEIYARNGRWNFNNKSFIRPCTVSEWAVVNFSCRTDASNLVRDLMRCGAAKGVKFDDPKGIYEESPQARRGTAIQRVDAMFQILKENYRTEPPKPPKFLLCLLPERKNSDIYGPWKRRCLTEFGVVTQCLSPNRINDQYLTNLLLKINAKLGGMNSLLNVEDRPTIPILSKVPTLILGLDVSHGSPGRSDVPSIAAVVSSREWPLISKYRAMVRTQSPKLEIIDSLFKPNHKPDGQKADDGMIREALIDFYASSGKQKPQNIIIFRDGVSESQFSQVLNKELDQIINACKFLDENWQPKFTLIIAQKNHHTKFFNPESADNVAPGTVVDTCVCHPHNYDFYMCSHAGMIGTTRPTHYHVLLDDIGFSPDDLQELVHALSYVYQRSTTAISVVAPICYAHLAASQVGQFIKFDELSETSSHGPTGSSGSIPVPELPVLHEKVESSMFFC